MLVKDTFAAIDSIIGITSVDSSADSIAIKGRAISFVCDVGNIWINPKSTSVADATSLKLTSGQSIDLVVEGNLSIISDAVGATYQVVFWA